MYCITVSCYINAYKDSSTCVTQSITAILADNNKENVG